MGYVVDRNYFLKLVQVLVDVGWGFQGFVCN